MQQKAQLLGIYASKGYTDLASIINHYNTFQAGGKLTFNEWKSQIQSKYPDIEMDNTKAGYDYVRYFNDNYDDAIRQLSNLQHFPDTYKLPNHPTFSNESIYSRGPMMGGNWVNDSTFSPSIINRQQYPEIYKEDRPYTEREIYGNKYQQGGHLYQEGGPTNNKSDWAKTHETKLILHQLGWDNPDNRLHSDYAAKDNEGYYAGYNLKPVTITAKHPIKDIEPNIKADRKYWDDLYQQYLRREEAGKNYMKWAASLAMSPLIPIAGPTVMNIMSNPLVDATFTADAVRNLPKALENIRDNFNEGKIGRGLLQTGETALDLLGAGNLITRASRMTNPSYRALHAYNTIIPISYENASKRGRQWLNSMWYNNTPSTKDIENRYLDETYKMVNDWSAGNLSKEELDNIVPTIAHNREDAFRMYLGMPQKHNTYTRLDNGNFRMNESAIPDEFLGALDFKNDPALTHGGLWSADFYREPETNLGLWYYTDKWDLQPFQRTDSSPIKRISTKLDKFETNLRNKAQDFRKKKYEQGVWGQGKYSKLDQYLNRFRTDGRMPWQADWHDLSYIQQLRNWIENSKTLEKLENKIKNIEIGPILGGKPFMMETLIPFRNVGDDLLESKRIKGLTNDELEGLKTIIKEENRIIN